MPRKKMPEGQTKKPKGVSLQPALQQVIEVIADVEDRSYSRTVEKFVKLGLKVYRTNPAFAQAAKPADRKNDRNERLGELSAKDVEKLMTALRELDEQLDKD